MRKGGNLPWMYSIIWPPRPESVVIVSLDNKPHESKQCKRKKVNNESLTGSVVRLSSMLWQAGPVVRMRGVLSRMAEGGVSNAHGLIDVGSKLNENNNKAPGICKEAERLKMRGEIWKQISCWGSCHATLSRCYVVLVPFGTSAAR
jgi:hypothetical protein